MLVAVIVIVVLVLLGLFFVVGFNRLLWNRLYLLAQERTRL